jgi:hypothetical protein
MKGPADGEFVYAGRGSGEVTGSDRRPPDCWKLTESGVFASQAGRFLREQVNAAGKDLNRS